MLRYHVADEDVELLTPPDGVTVEHFLETKGDAPSHVRRNLHIDVQPSDLISPADILAVHQPDEDHQDS